MSIYIALELCYHRPTRGYVERGERIDLSHLRQEEIDMLRDMETVCPDEEWLPRVRLAPHQYLGGVRIVDLSLYDLRRYLEAVEDDRSPGVQAARALVRRDDAMALDDVVAASITFDHRGGLVVPEYVQATVDAQKRANQKSKAPVKVKAEPEAKETEE